MTHYHQTDALSLDTSVAVSGTGGSSTPEAAAGNSSYSSWSWEAILATVLRIPVSDRSEVTGQPWLMVVSADQADQGAHQIWSASWSSKPKHGSASSLRVYLDPALYAGGGAWDRFSNVPGQALSGQASGLPLVPESFAAGKLALASVTTGFRDMSASFDALHHHLTTESTPFQGNAASVIAELIGDLHGATLSIYDQLSNPSRSDAVGSAGDAATAFLSAINAAYEAWNQLPEHSPLGAIVQVLTSIATPDGSGGYTIPDPENTPFGDLTSPQAWSNVEQQAKGRWLDPLTGSSPDFGGLDSLGRSALGQLTEQYATTMGIVVPVAGPGMPSAIQSPAGGPNGFGNGGGPHGGPDSGRTPRADFVTGGSGGGLPFAGGTNQPAGPAPPPAVAGFLVQSAAGSPGTAPPATPPVEEDAGHSELEMPDTPGFLSRAIGAQPRPNDNQGSGQADGQHESASDGFTGTVGRVRKPKGLALRHPGRGPQEDSKKPDVLTAPAAGFSVGGGPHGSVLARAAVPSVAAKPPNVTSGQVNMQLTPGGADGGTLAVAGQGGGQVTAPLSGPAGAPLAGPVGGPAGGSNFAVGQPPPAVAGGTAGPLAGPGAHGGANGPMAVPPRSGAGSTGRLGQDDERRAYLPEDEDYWGTGQGLPGPADRPGADEPDFDVPRVIVGIGAEAEPPTSQETMSNWRTR
jgi:hypothetical protein